MVESKMLSVHRLARCTPAIVLLAGLVCIAACGHSGSSRRRRRKARPRVLIDAKRMRSAVVDRSKSGRLKRDVDALRESLCEGRVGDRVIFYQLVVSRHWHYYWLCSGKKAKRAWTSQGARTTKAWLRGIRRRARRESKECEEGTTSRLFKVRHESGVILRAYCDGIISLTYPDRSKSTVSFTRNEGPAVSPEPGLTNKPITVGCPPCRPATCPPASCPPQRTCPRVAACPPQRSCPRCPPQRVCPPPPRCPKPPPCLQPNTPKACKTFGKKAFWLGVKQACQRICTGIYKKCRKINPKTALCYQLSEYCAAMKGVCDRANAGR